MKTLFSLGCGFIVKSKDEILLANDCGLDPSKILFKNEMLVGSHLKMAAKHQIGLVAFTSVAELNKIKKNYPDVR